MRKKIAFLRWQIYECTGICMICAITANVFSCLIFFVNSKPLHRYQHCLLGKARERINTYWVCEDSNFLKVRCASGTFSTILHKGFSRVAFITSREKHFKGAIFSFVSKTLHDFRSNFLFHKIQRIFYVLLSVVLTKTP